MLLIDSHLDLAWSAIDWDRNLDLEVAAIREIERQRIEAAARADPTVPQIMRSGWSQKPGAGRNTVSLPELRAAEAAVTCATVLDRTAHAHSPAAGSACQELSYAKAQGQLAYYRVLQAQGKVQLLGDTTALDALWQRWENGDLEAPLGFILSMEGADPIVSPQQVHSWWQDGLRVASLCHYGASAYAYGTATEGGVTELGKELLKEMRACGMILDLSHLAEQAFWEALEAFDGPILASHNNCQALVPGDRQFSDEQMRAICERGGVIGVALDAWMLYPGWVRGETQPEVVGLEALARQIDHICVLAGNAEHVAVGSDLDGGFGTEQTPHDLQTYRDLQRLPELLRPRGYREEDVAAVMHGNWLRLFRQAWSHNA
jgi:membrane dipeptidase